MLWNIIELELNRDPLFFNSSSSRGYAIIEPLPNVNEDISLIPHIAHFTDRAYNFASFQIIPECAPPICSQCQHMGYAQNECPDNLLRLLKKSSDPSFSDAKAMDIDGDDFLDTHSEATTEADSSETNNSYF